MVPEHRACTCPKQPHPHVVHPSNTARRAPCNVANQSQRTAESKPWPHLCPKAAKERPGRIPLVRRRRARNKLNPRTLQVDVHIQYGIVSTKLWGSKRLRKISHAREAILHAVQARALRSSSPHGKLRIEMRGSREGKTYCTTRCVKWRPVTATSREPVDGF